MEAGKVRASLGGTRETASQVLGATVGSVYLRVRLPARVLRSLSPPPPSWLRFPHQVFSKLLRLQGSRASTQDTCPPFPILSTVTAAEHLLKPSLGREGRLEEGMATHSSVLAWRIPTDRGAWGYSPWGHKESDMPGKP